MAPKIRWLLESADTFRRATKHQKESCRQMEVRSFRARCGARTSSTICTQRKRKQRLVTIVIARHDALLLSALSLVSAESRRVERPRINQPFYSLQHLQLESLNDGYLSKEPQLFTKHIEVFDEFGAKTLYKYRIQKRNQPIYQVNEDHNVIALECDIDVHDSLVLHFADIEEVQTSQWTRDMFVGVGEEWQCAQQNGKYSQEWRYVESLEWRGDSLHLRTTRAGLADVFESFKMHFRYDPPKERSKVTNKPHMKLKVHDHELDTKRELLVSFSVPLASASWNFNDQTGGALEPAVELYSIDFEAFRETSFLSLGAGLAVNCRECFFDFNSAIEFVLETTGIIGIPTGISEFRVALIGDLQYRFELELEANARLVLDNPFENEILRLPLGSIGLPYTAGLISLSPELALTGSIDATGNVVARINGVGVELPAADGDFMFGYEWTESGGSREIIQFPGWFSPLTPTIELEDASFELNAGIYPSLAITLNIPGLEGLSVGAELQPEFTFRFELDDDTCNPLIPNEDDIPELPANALLSVDDEPWVFSSNNSSMALQQVNLPDSLLVRYDTEFGMDIAVGLLEDIVLTAVFFIPITLVEATTFDITLIPRAPLTCSFCSGCHELLGNDDAPAVQSVNPTCEGDEITLSCSDDETITLIDAFYGTTGTANRAGCSDANDNCVSTTAFGAVQALCDGQSSCTFAALNEVLGGDPCPNFIKFFEADWMCSAVEPEQDDVRVLDGATALRGRVEVFNSGEWGTVCDTTGSWSLTEADTVCYQLGLGLALEATNDARFGEGAGSIWLSGVDCNGEASLAECATSAAGEECSHENDVGVSCTGAHEVRQNSGTDGRFWLAAHGVSLGTVEQGANEVYYHLYPGTATSLRIRALSYDPESNVDLFVYESTERLNNDDPVASASQSGWGFAGRDEITIDLENDLRDGARAVNEFHAIIVSVRGVGAGSNDYSVVIDSFTDVDTSSANGVSTVDAVGIYRTEYQYYSYTLQSDDVTAVIISAPSSVDLFATASRELEYSLTPDRISSTWSSTNDGSFEVDVIPIFSSFGASLEVGDQIAIGVYGEVGDEPYTLTITEYADLESGEALDSVSGSNQYELHFAARTERLVVTVASEANVPVEFNVRFISVATDGRALTDTLTPVSQTLTVAGETAVLETDNLITPGSGYRPILDVNTEVGGVWSATFGSVQDVMLGQASEANLYAGRYQFFSVSGLPNMPESPNRLLVRTSGSGAVYLSPSLILPREADDGNSAVGTIPAGDGPRGLVVAPESDLYPTDGVFYGGIVSPNAGVVQLAVTGVVDLTGESPVNGSLASLESHTFTIPAELFSQTEIGLFVRLTLPSNATADEADLYVDAVPTEDALPAALDRWSWQSTAVGNDGVYLLKQGNEVCNVPARAEAEAVCLQLSGDFVHVAVAARDQVPDIAGYELSFELLSEEPLVLNRSIEDVFLQNASATIEIQLTADDFIFDGPSLGWDIMLGAFVESSLADDPNGFLAIYEDILNSTNLQQTDDGHLILEIPANENYAPADDEVITLTIRETLTMSNAVSRVQFTLSDGRADAAAASTTTLTTPQLAGIIGGGAGVLLVLGLTVFCCLRKRKKDQIASAGTATSTV